MVKFGIESYCDYDKDDLTKIPLFGIQNGAPIGKHCFGHKMSADSPNFMKFCMKMQNPRLTMVE